MPDVGDEARATLDRLVGVAVDNLRSDTEKILEAVFGKYGHLQTDIPERMRRGDVKNPAVAVFGYGDWVKDHGVEGVKPLMANVKPKLVRYLPLTARKLDEQLLTLGCRIKVYSGKWLACSRKHTS